MLNRHHLTAVDALRKNKRETPAAFITDIGRERNTRLFGCQEWCTLSSYVTKVNLIVLLLSSVHNDDTIDESTGDAKKHDMITFYNKSNGGVDVVDKLYASNTCARNTRRWPMVIFDSILNVAWINSGIIRNENNS